MIQDDTFEEIIVWMANARTPPIAKISNNN